jgi:hypothetical protein
MSAAEITADLAVAGAAQLLERAAASMTKAAHAVPKARRRHPVATDLLAAADTLAAGRDLLCTHHDPGWPANSGDPPWARLISSRPYGRPGLWWTRGRRARSAVRLGSCR